jgi:AcrR family transcriptional regulator
VKRVAGATRDAILASAATEFAAHGFAGASVDDIARRSGFNKAMIYYHFRSKQGLYAEILGGVFRAVGARTGEIAASGLAPAAKIEAVIDAFDRMAESRPYMPRVMMREMASGALRLDRGTLRLMAVIFRNIERILDEGARARAFRRADPTLTYFSLILPVIFFRATAPIRDAFNTSGVLALRPSSPEFVANLKRTAAAALAPDAGTTRPLAGSTPPLAGSKDPAYVRTATPVPAGARRAAPRRRSSRSTRPGDHR